MTNILMVEDDWEQLDRMKYNIESAGEGYNFFGSATAQEGLNLVRKQKIDLIILDNNLSEQSGIELAQKIRKIPGYEFIWIIVLTGQRMHLNEVLEEIHCYDYFPRQYDAQDVLRAIELLCGYQVKPVSEADKEYVIFKQRDIYVRVLAKDILYIEVLSDNSMLFTNSQKIVLPLIH